MINRFQLLTSLGFEVVKTSRLKIMSVSFWSLSMSDVTYTTKSPEEEGWHFGPLSKSFSTGPKNWKQMPDRFYQYRIRKTGNKCQTDLINTEFKELIPFQTF